MVLETIIPIAVAAAFVLGLVTIKKMDLKDLFLAAIVIGMSITIPSVLGGIAILGEIISAIMAVGAGLYSGGIVRLVAERLSKLMKF